MTEIHQTAGAKMNFNHWLLFFSLLIPFQQVVANPWGIVGDAGHWNTNTQAVRDSLMRQNHFDLILPGDNLYRGTYDQTWQPWKNQNFRFDIVALGNHHDGYENEISFFQMPGEYFKKTLPQDRTTFYVLNSDNTKNVSEQLSWLDQELSADQTTFVFIVFHHPNLTVTKSGHAWTEKKQFQETLRPLLKKHRSKITALINGHDHIASLHYFDDLPVIVSGSTQSPDNSKPINNIQSGIKVSTKAFYSGEPLWVSLAINDQTSTATVNFYRANDDTLLFTTNL